MQKTNELVTRLTPHCIGENCVQVMVPYKHSLTHLNKDGILYHFIPDSYLHINKYIEDERRKQFPYFNIPTHREKLGYHILNYTNQIFNYDEPYISIGDGHIVESYVVKDGNSALMLTKKLNETDRISYMTRMELEKLFQKSSDDEQLYTMNLGGGFYEEDYSIEIPSEETILSCAKTQLMKNLEEYKKSILPSDRSILPKPFNESGVNLLENCINNMSVDCLLENTKFINDDIVVVRVKNKDISINVYSIRFIKPENYKVSISDVPVTKYTLEQLKFLTPKINLLKDTKISTRLNPGILKSEIKDAKRLAKTLDKK